MARAIPRWARDTDAGPTVEEIANAKLQTDARRERLQVPPEIRSLPLDPERARIELSEEQRTLRTPSRGGRKWQAIAAFDERVLSLQNQQATLRAEAAALRDRVPAAEVADMQRLAGWHEGGQQGERPHPEKAELEQQLERIDQDARALDRLIDEALNAKAEHVERHRKRLAREAAADVERAHADYVKLVRELEQAREELVESRRTLRWANHFPGEEATSDNILPTMLAGGLQGPVRRTLGTLAQIAFASMAAALAADADALRDGIRGREDRELDPREDALWEATPEGNAALNRERGRLREAALARNHRQPGWWE
jgi:hypothetical protein